MGCSKYRAVPIQCIFSLISGCILSESESESENELIVLSEPEISGNEWRYIKECLDTGWVSSVGSYVNKFESEIAREVGCAHGIATVNGTAALHVALMVAGIEADDEVLIPSLTFIAPANAIRYIGAWPVFIDAERDYWQLDPQKLEDFLKRDCAWRNGALHDSLTGKKVKAVLPVHILGHPTDMGAVVDIARKYDLAVIEDATESLGASYKGAKTGSLGDIACFSFNGNKIITTGGGGMVVTNRDDWAQRTRYLTTQAKNDTLEYVHEEIGYNYRLSNMQAAMGCAQLERLEEFITRKREIAEVYTHAFADISGIRPMKQSEWSSSIWWLYTILIQQENGGMGSRQIIDALGKVGVQCRPLWQPLHMSPAHAKSRKTDCSFAEQLYREAISLPCSVGLEEKQQDRVIRTLRQFFQEGLS